MPDLGFWNFAQQDADKLALVDPRGREWSRGELFADANRVAHGLRALGLERGDAVAVVLENCAEFYAINLAITQIGMYMTPINNHLTAPEIAYILQDSEAKVFIGSEQFADECIAAREEAEESSPRMGAPVRTEPPGHEKRDNRETSRIFDRACEADCDSREHERPRTPLLEQPK